MNYYMNIPKDFRYREVLLRGMPEHGPTDPFRIRHPRMDIGHRAKIFAPFDALKGFNDALAASRQLAEARMAPEVAAPEGSGDSDVYSILY